MSIIGGAWTPKGGVIAADSAAIQGEVVGLRSDKAYRRGRFLVADCGDSALGQYVREFIEEMDDATYNPRHSFLANFRQSFEDFRDRHKIGWSDALGVIVVCREGLFYLSEGGTVLQKGADAHDRTYLFDGLGYHVANGAMSAFATLDVEITGSVVRSVEMAANVASGCRPPVVAESMTWDDEVPK